jgi:hypothetical protein
VLYVLSPLAQYQELQQKKQVRLQQMCLWQTCGNPWLVFVDGVSCMSSSTVPGAAEEEAGALAGTRWVCVEAL